MSVTEVLILQQTGYQNKYTGESERELRVVEELESIWRERLESVWQRKRK